MLGKNTAVWSKSGRPVLPHRTSEQRANGGQGTAQKFNFIIE
jgi:hypothetical protein